MISILLVDDHDIVRRGIQALLEYELDFNVIGHARNGKDALSFLERICPDIIVTDLSMPLCSGVELAAEVQLRGLLTKVIFLTMHDGEPYIAAAFNAGATAYVLKQNGVEDLAFSIREALSGRRFASPPLTLPMQ